VRDVTGKPQHSIFVPAGHCGQPYLAKEAAMAIRALIEREIKSGSEIKLHQLLLKLRAKAMQAKGYISGETLRALDNPNKFLVISTWNSLAEWETWDKDPVRMEVQEEVDKLLRYPSKTSIYIYG
jgi:heme oxygenase (mycobilin-producing)